LIQAIDNFGENYCGAPRDKVYGLMGIVNKEERLVMDYGKTVCHVYMDVVKNSLEGGTHRLQRIKTLLTLSESMGFQKDQRTGLAKLLDAMFEQVCGLIRCIGYKQRESRGTHWIDGGTRKRAG
jgi:predicted nuclease with TOPRIM domain